MEEIQLMKKLFTLLAVLAVVAFCITGMVAEEPHHTHAAVLKHATPGVHSNAAPTGIWIPWADFASFSGATNADSSYLWPCFGNYDGSNTSSENPDCPTIGDPTVPFGGGVVLGDPSYLWTVADCNATSTSSPACADQESFITDNTADLTDDLTVSIVITQGSNTIYDTGTYDYGENVFGLTAADFPILWINYNPQNLGDMGIATGPNNGNCSPNINYPLTTNSFTVPYAISANKTCSPAAAGVANGTFTVEYATPKYTKETKAADCDGVPTPCYTVKYTSKYKASYKFTIDLY